ncbi:MAG: aromatic ring-hydroxylating dioxygenase subunit alpha [Gammaproteobacteria bacterium]|nr:aromatic ring-hydroxylating dioxygenase subunit alpha [Gammaproteobacteria bacterium]
MILKNAWYAAAWDREVARTLLPLTIGGERIVLYRTLAGDPVALEDACAHRKLPLSMGRLTGDSVECGYHGMVYGASGRCTHIPGFPRVPAVARVRSYPVAFRYGLVWIWMGDPARADPTSIFPVEHWDDPAWGRTAGGSMPVACNYLFITDNLLDPSHVAWVHRSSFGNEACEEEPVETTESAAGVVASRWMRDVEAAPFYRSLVGFTGRCDRLQHYEVRYPSHAIIKAVFVPAGVSGASASQHPHAMLMDSYNFMTPIDENQTRYFWFQLRNFAPQDSGVSQMMEEGVRAAFAEDRIVLEAVHEGFRNQVTRNIDLAIDRPSLLFRKRLAQMIAAENADAGPASGPSPSTLSTLSPRKAAAGTGSE